MNIEYTRKEKHGPVYYLTVWFTAWLLFALTLLWANHIFLGIAAFGFWKAVLLAIPVMCIKIVADKSDIKVVTWGWFIFLAAVVILQFAAWVGLVNVPLFPSAPSAHIHVHGSGSVEIGN